MFIKAAFLLPSAWISFLKMIFASGSNLTIDVDCSIGEHLFYELLSNAHQSYVRITMCRE